MSSDLPTPLRALVVAVQHPIDRAWRVRPGAITAARRVSQLLQGAEAEVRLLVDDAPDESDRPTLASMLAQLRWLSEGERGLLVLSGHVHQGCFITRDARSGLEDRTGLPLSELSAQLSHGCGLIVDGGLAADDVPGAQWILAAAGAGMQPAPLSDRGPSRFMHRLLQGLAGAPSPGAPVTARQLSHYVIDHAPAAASTFPGMGPWCHGDWTRHGWSAPLCTPGQPDACPRCGAEVKNAAAAFCHSCGAPLQAPETLDRGRYRLIHALGAGGMGQVYVAEDTRLQVRRALKLISVPPDLPPEEAQGLADRLIQEARAAQALGDHTHNVVRVFDVGHSPERGQPFLVMELLEGVTLSDRLVSGPMTVGEALAFGEVVARTLAVAHGMGLVHRDLKPDNVMLVRRGDDDAFVKLLDFGLVKMADGPAHTRSGRMMGTLQYMPPEQLRGQTVDARADVFALGAVLYECLSGVRANPGRTQGEIFKVLLDAGVKPLRAVAPDVPQPLAELIDQCLSLTPTDRPAEAGAVADALSEVSAGLSAEALALTLTPSLPPVQPAPAPRPTPESAPPMLAPRPGRGVLVAVLALALLGGVALAIWPEGNLNTSDAGIYTVATGDSTAHLTVDAAVHTTASHDAGTVEQTAPDARVADAAAIQADAAQADAAQPPPPEIPLRGVGGLRRTAEEALLFSSVRCGDAAEGERLLAARWLIPGHTQGRCKGLKCLDELPRALKTARRSGETLRLWLTVSPNPPEGHSETRSTDDAQPPPSSPPRTAHCRVSPRAGDDPR
ncbi:MAG: protein kinase domain-containing protein [Bradymonadia bacterium]